MKAEDIHNHDADVRRIYYDHFCTDAAFLKTDSHRRHSIDLLLHYYPQMDREAQERARKTIANLEQQLIKGKK